VKCLGQLQADLTKLVGKNHNDDIPTLVLWFAHQRPEHTKSLLSHGRSIYRLKRKRDE